MTFTIVTHKVITLLPDDTVFKSYSISGGSWAHAENRIGEKKRLEIEYTSDVDITGHNMYINAALFMREDHAIYYSGKGTVYYLCNIADATLGNVYPAPLQSSVSTPGYNIQVNENFSVRVIPNGGFAFKIQVDFFMVADNSDNYVRSVIEHGVDLLISDANAGGAALLPDNSNAASIPTGNGSVYQAFNPGPPFSIQIRSPRVYVYSELPGSFPLISTSKEYRFSGFKAGWYNQNAWKTSPWFTETQFILKRGGNVVTDLSSTLDTDVEVFVTSASGTEDVTKMLVWIIRTSQFDFNEDFFTNLDAEFEVIEAANVSTGKLKAPMTDPVNTSGNIWKSTFKVGPVSLTDTYRLIGVAYSDNAVYKVNSFISQLLPVVVGGVGPQYLGNGFNPRASIDDFNRQFNGNDLECVIEERLRSKIKLDFPFDKWKNDIFNRLGLVTSNDIRRYLTSVKVEFYEEYTEVGLGNVKNIFDVKVSNKVGVNNYTAQSGMNLTFSSAWAEFTYDWRNRFESNIPCIQTLVNGVNVMPQLATQYWGGKTIKIRWILNFYYDDYSTPFTDEIVFDQQIRVNDYGGMEVLHIDEETTEYSDLTFICDNERICYAGVLPGVLADRNLIANIYPLNGTVNNVDEGENWDGNQLPTLLSDKFSSLYESYQPLGSEFAAKFCVNGNELLINSQYVISAMAKKFVDTGYRITEKENPSVFEDRIAENTDKRITDNI